MAKWVGISDLAAFTAGVMSAAGIKKAAQTGRIPAKKSGRVWLVDADSETAQGWIAAAKAEAEPDDVAKLRAEIAKLTRDNKNLAKRVRQAEAAQRRAERSVKQLEAELAEAYRTAHDQANQHAQQMYDLSHEVIERAANENTRTLIKVVSMLTGMDAPRQVLAGQVADDRSAQSADGRERG